MTNFNLRDFTYSVSSDINLNAAVKIESMHGVLPQPSIGDILKSCHLELKATNEPHELYVSVALYQGNQQQPVFLTSKTNFSKTTKEKDGLFHWSWNEWITLLPKIKHLKQTAYILFTIYDIIEPKCPIKLGQCSISLFDEDGLLKKGQYRLLVDVVGQPPQEDAATLVQLDKALKQYECGDLDKVPWQDDIAFQKIEALRKETLLALQQLFLYIRLPHFDFVVIYNESPSLAKPPNPFVYCVDVFDPEIGKENQAELKHRMLARSHRNGYIDRNLKPNSKTRDELQAILGYPTTRGLTVPEKDLVWNYRFHLSRDKKALTKFLKSVTWNDSIESKQAVELLMTWASPDIDDVLELLGPEFENSAVRSYAVKQLAKADDDELSLYLLQLVQALKFEAVGDKSVLLPFPAASLSEFLIQRAIRNANLGYLLFWYLTVETYDRVHEPMYKAVLQQFCDLMSQTSDGAHRRDILHRQEDLVRKLTALTRELRMHKDPRPRKIERLRELLQSTRYNLVHFPPLPLPLDPSVLVIGIVPSLASIFKSQLMPLRLVFACIDGSEYPVIFKLGDDLRQDQLIIQIIHLMDKLLQKENLDLKLTPYKVLATGPDQGFVQYIPSLSLATILSDFNSIQVFLRKHNSDDSSSSSYGISANAMDTYVRSCAAYCVITYLLGVGDRHLDNLLLSPKGNLFHIDFGYILGRDPKPFPPPMKLCKEMVEAMGGHGSAHYTRFKNYCFIAFSSLRKSANLILNLLTLMVDANITDIAMEPDKAVLKVYDKFRLDLAEEEAILFFGLLIADSVNALFPQVIETIHKWAQYWRK